MTTLEAFDVIRTACPGAGSWQGKTAFGRQILASWKSQTTPEQRQLIIDRLGEPAKTAVINALKVL